MHSFCLWAAWSRRWHKWGCRHRQMKCWVGLRQPLGCEIFLSAFQLPQYFSQLRNKGICWYIEVQLVLFSFRTYSSYSVRICCGEKLEDPRTILLFRVSVPESNRREGEIAKWYSTVLQTEWVMDRPFNAVFELPKPLFALPKPSISIMGVVLLCYEIWPDGVSCSVTMKKKKTILGLQQEKETTAGYRQTRSRNSSQLDGIHHLQTCYI